MYYSFVSELTKVRSLFRKVLFLAPVILRFSCCLLSDLCFPSQQGPALRLATEAGQPPHPGPELPGGGAGLPDHPHAVRSRGRCLHAARQGQFAL